MKLIIFDVDGVLGDFEVLKSVRREEHIRSPRERTEHAASGSDRAAQADTGKL